MYKMEVWEAVKMYEGLIYRDRHLLDALRLNTLMSVLPHTTQQMGLTDVVTYPWDDETQEEQSGEEINIEELKALSSEIAKTINR